MKTRTLQKSILTLALAAGLYACSKNDAPAPAVSHFRPANDTSKKFISRVYEYLPAPGQFVNTPATGSIEGAQLITGGFNGLLSLGGYGGYVIFGFDHSIENKTSHDLAIYGNPLVNKDQEWSEPGIVLVMQDLNGNGLPDDNAWYELAGSEYAQTGTIKKYRIAYFNPKNTTADIVWKDNQGKTGYILRNMFHNQEYYPAWAANQDSLVFEGTLLKSTLGQEYNPDYGIGLITNKPMAWGYADNGSAIFLEVREAEGRGYNKFDIDWAVDQDGKKVALPYIDFVKVYTGQNSNGDPGTDPGDPNRMLGEISTEISGARDLHLQ